MAPSLYLHGRGPQRAGLCFVFSFSCFLLFFYMFQLVSTTNVFSNVHQGLVFGKSKMIFRCASPQIWASSFQGTLFGSKAKPRETRQFGVAKNLLGDSSFFSATLLCTNWDWRSSKNPGKPQPGRKNHTLPCGHHHAEPFWGGGTPTHLCRCSPGLRF